MLLFLYFELLYYSICFCNLDFFFFFNLLLPEESLCSVSLPWMESSKQPPYDRGQSGWEGQKRNKWLEHREPEVAPLTTELQSQDMGLGDPESKC